MCAFDIIRLIRRFALIRQEKVMTSKSVLVCLLLLLFVVGCDKKTKASDEANTQYLKEDYLKQSSENGAQNSLQLPDLAGSGISEISPTLVDPLIVKKLVTERNVSVLLGDNSLRASKKSVEQARFKLFPSVNVGAFTMALGSPTFLLSSVDILLPFLLPSNWFELARSKAQYEADKLAFQLVEMNEVASGLSLFYTLQNDNERRRILESNLQDSIFVEKVAIQAYQLGIISEEDLSLARSQTSFSQLQIANFDGYHEQTQAAFKKALGYPQEVALQLSADKVVAPSDLETLSVVQVMGIVSPRLLELQQIQALLGAAKNEKWNRFFGFLGSSSIGTAASSPTAANPSPQLNTNFDQLLGRASMNFGLDRISLVQLSNLKSKEIALRAVGILQETERLVDVVLVQLNSAKRRLEEASRSANELRQVFVSQLHRFGQGTASIQALIQTRDQISNAETLQMGAQLDLNLLRITLHRLARSGDFADVSGCRHVDAKDLKLIPTLKLEVQEERMKLFDLCKNEQSQVLLKKKPVTTPIMGKRN